MPNPNQLTACATSTKQGVYKGYVRMYNEIEGKYGLLYEDFYFGPKTRNRSVAIKAAREVIKSLKDLTDSDKRIWLENHQSESLWKINK